MKLRTVRRTLAIVFFTFLTLLFLDFSGTLHHWFGWMAKVQFLPALLSVNIFALVILTVLTFLFGRVYCSIICPLGVFQDVVARVRRLFGKKKYSFSNEKRWLRYGFLVLIIVGLVSGTSIIVALLDPYSIYGRMASTLFQPVYILGNNLLAYFAERIDSYAFYSVDVWLRGISTLTIAIAMFVIVGFLAWKNGRTYCNTVCPVGTFLGFLSRFSLLKIYFDETKCRNCSKCTTACKASCIDYKTHKVDYSRCVVCGNCLTECHFDSLHYGLPRKKEKKNITEKPTDKSKRSFLIGTSMIATAALAEETMKLDGGLAELKERRQWKRQSPLTPPGSQSIQNLRHHCTACQLCVAECPNGVLRPSTDFDHFMQPEMSYERGFCRPECTRCSQVCPTGAIKEITKEEKSSTQIGHAFWQQFNCIVLTDDVDCGNCARHCPSGAIEMVPLHADNENSRLVPAVDEEYCIGCGACEYVCPARPLSAIHVEGHEVHKEIS